MIHVAFANRASLFRSRTPEIHDGDREYDAHLNRFLRELPSIGARSPRTARAYAHDLCLWVRFLREGFEIGVWAATYDHVRAYHDVRRDGSPFACSEATWNRSVAALEKLYSWALDENLVSQMPFRYARARGRANQFNAGGPRNRAYEPNPPEHGEKGVSPEIYAKFRECGLRGHTLPGGATSRHRNGARNVAFADLLVCSGLRLQEAGSLITFEWKRGSHRAGTAPNAFFRPARSATKGRKKRKTIIPGHVIRAIDNYVAIERSLAVAKGYVRRIWEEVPEVIFIRERASGELELKTDEGWRLVDRDNLTPDIRYRLVECSADGDPIGFACLWLTETGRPVDPNTWEVAFRRACRRCRDHGIDVEITPHTLRHTFATYILPAIEKMFARVEAETGVPQGSPIRHVQQLLGHASSATTELFYLPALSSNDLTIDQHVETFFATFTGNADAAS